MKVNSSYSLPASLAFAFIWGVGGKSIFKILLTQPRPSQNDQHEESASNVSTVIGIASAVMAFAHSYGLGSPLPFLNECFRSVMIRDPAHRLL